MTTGSPAERLDLALDQLLAGSRPRGDGALAPLLDAAALVREAVPPIPAGARFDARMLERLTRREFRHSGRILAAGAVSTAAVGVTVTAVAVWRSRRGTPPAAARK